jgi:hypothetical protein
VPLHSRRVDRNETRDSQKCHDVDLLSIHFAINRDNAANAIQSIVSSQTCRGELKRPNEQTITYYLLISAWPVQKITQGPSQRNLKESKSCYFHKTLPEGRWKIGMHPGFTHLFRRIAPLTVR